MECDRDDTASSTSRHSNVIQSSGDALSFAIKSPQIATTPSLSEYHFGMCVAQMFEDVPKARRVHLKANIFNILAKEFDAV